VKIFSLGELASLLEVERVIEQPDDYKNIQIPRSISITNFRSEIVRLNFIGSWDENYAGDKQAVASILNTSSYEEANEIIQNILNCYPNLLYFSRGRYIIKDRIQLLEATSNYLINDSFKDLEPLFEKILSEQDPLINLPIEKIIENEIMGCKMHYSSSIRIATASTLAILSNNASLITHASEAASNIPLSILRKLINEGTNWDSFLSISEFFPIFAEINPIIYLNCIEEFLEKQLIGSNKTRKTKIQSLRNNHSLHGQKIPYLDHVIF